jgi:hypothetical protein
MILALRDQRAAFLRSEMAKEVRARAGGIDLALAQSDEFYARRGDPNCGSPKQFLEGIER